MRFLSLLVFLITIFSTSYSQSISSKSKAAPQETIVFTKVELNAGPQNPMQWEKYLRQALILPDTLASTLPPGTYPVLVEFIVDIHGSLVQVKVTNDCPTTLAKKTIETIKSYPGAWQPATQCGRQVKSYQRQALVYKIGK